MITLLAFGVLALLSCLAAAGLIASTQNQTVDEPATTGLDVTPDARA